MIKVTYEINLNGISSKLEADYATYDELDKERNTLLNSVNFAFNDLSKKLGIVNREATRKPKIDEKIDGPATPSQLNYLHKLGWNDDPEGLTYSEANILIRQLKVR